MCVVDLEECDCDCHGELNIMHIIPCCTICRYCHKRVSTLIELHEQTCENRDDYIKLVIRRNK